MGQYREVGLAIGVVIGTLMGQEQSLTVMVVAWIE